MTVASGIILVAAVSVPPRQGRAPWDKRQLGDETWLIGEQRASGEQKYYLASQPAETNLRTLVHHHQGTMGLRAGPPADERRTRSRSLRGTGPGKACTDTCHDNDCVRLPSASSPHPSEAGKKKSTVRYQPSLPAVRCGHQLHHAITTAILGSAGIAVVVA